MNNSDTPKPTTRTITARFIRVLGQASTAEGEFLNRLVAAWESKGDCTTLQESTFDFATDHYGLDFMHMQDMAYEWKELANEINEAFKILHLGHSRASVRAALRTMLNLSAAGGLQKLADMLYVVEDEMQEEEKELEDARETLKKRPDALKKEIREAITKHPEIIEGM